MPGKGEVLWRSLLATRGEIVCFVDADLRAFDSSFVSGIVGPLLTDPGVQLVKAMYDRPLETGGAVVPAGGGRVTELVARPLLNLHWPRLAGFVQPLGGEYAARRSLLERLPFPVGYGVELGDARRRAGAGRVWTRWRRWTSGCGTTGTRTGRRSGGWPRRSTGPRRCGWRRGIRCGRCSRSSSGGTAGFVPSTHPVDAEERPPMVFVPEYRHPRGLRSRTRRRRAGPADWTAPRVACARPGRHPAGGAQERRGHGPPPAGGPDTAGSRARPVERGSLWKGPGGGFRRPPREG